jgi:hypothetical protein
MKGGQSWEVGSRESHKDGAVERRDGVASARAVWKGGVRVERRFFRTRSRWPRAMERLRWIFKEDFGGEAAADGIEEGGVGRGCQGSGRHRW